MKKLHALVLGSLSLSVAAVLACSSDGATSSSGGSTSSGGSSASSSSGASSSGGSSASSSGASSSSSSASSSSTSSGGDAGGDDAGAFALTSSAFVDAGNIPTTHTCDAAGTSFPLAWTGAPATAKAFAIVMRDTSLAGANNVHWVIYDVPPATSSLTAAVPTGYSIATPVAAHQAKDSFSSTFAYLGPCPPKGASAHVYELTLHALDVAAVPGVDQTTATAAVIAAITTHSVASTKLTGKYAR